MLKVLLVELNKLKKSCENQFENLKELRLLRLNHNKLEHTSKEYFKHLDKLELYCSQFSHCVVKSSA